MVELAEAIGATRLVGEEEAKYGRLKEVIDYLANDSQMRWLFWGSSEVGEESGGVTGGLFEMRRGGRDDGIESRKKVKG
ncbi:hypothetical protein L1887_10697 [Cichorium endivia]|nr:hypothetical protein L1887_10697 [Cichorium endivia]